MSPMLPSGQMISTLTIGSSTIGRAFSIASRNAFAPGGDERDLLRVDRVVLAVVDGDAHVLHRIAGDRARGEHLLDAFLAPPG